MVSELSPEIRSRELTALRYMYMGALVLVGAAANQEWVQAYQDRLVEIDAELSILEEAES